MEMDHQRRFGGVARLYGDAGALQLAAAHVCVVGVGGVGSWAAEALARSAVGKLTLIDLDMVAESNTNRQIQALGNTYGQAKVDALYQRIALINPLCQVDTIEDFVTPENAATLITREFSWVIDAIDEARTKVAMLAHCKRQGIPVITAGAAGGQVDPTRIRIEDLARTEQDPLLAKVRNRLRKEHHFTRKPGAKFGLPAVYSTEPLRYPDRKPACETNGAGSPLACAGFGSSVCVTASFGMAAAAYVLQAIATSAA